MSHLWFHPRTNPLFVPMLASELADLLGPALIGRTVRTPDWRGVFSKEAYPGGKAVITTLAPDDHAPEIVFVVLHPTFGECGVFDNEEVVLLP